MSTILDGFILIFIGYNSTILTKINKWEESKIFYLDLNFHLSSALGGLFCLLFAKDSNKDALNLAAIITLIAFLVSIALINISSFAIYLCVFSIICISNGHLQNICVNAIVKKFSEKTRAVFWGYAYFFNQFGKFLFASLIFKFDKDIKDGKIDITIFPIFTIIMIQIVFIIILLTLMKKRSILKQKIKLKKDNIIEKEKKVRKTLLKEKEPIYIGDVDNPAKAESNEEIKEKKNHFDLNIPKEIDLETHAYSEKEYGEDRSTESVKFRNSYRNVSSLLIGNIKKELDINNKTITENFSSDDVEKRNLKKQFYQKNKSDKLELRADPKQSHSTKIKPLSNKEYIVSNLQAIFAHEILHHQLSMIFINFSLGIQFFSLINIFPHLHYNYTYSILTEEIFFSKLIHLILLFFFPLIFISKKANRKNLLLFAFFSNLIINVLVLVNCLNSTAFVHIFRFIWNICYITTNLYNCEAAPHKIRYLNTSIMNLFFKLSCMIEIIVIERLIKINLYLPVVFNLFILLMDNLLVSKLEYETHFKSLELIKSELN